MSRVLMVDDAGLFQMLEASFLRRLGCEIVRASAGREVLEKARRSLPDLILLDADHPGIDGPECIRALKADPALRPTPVLVVSSTDGVAPCCEAGADATLSRPLTPGALELALGSLGRIGQRVGPRRSVRFSARVASEGAARRCRIKDISRTGLFLTLPEPLPLQAPITLSLRLPAPDGSRRVRARGVVVRQVRDDPESHLIPGVGVRFVAMDPTAESLIEGYVNDTAAGGVTADGPPEERERG